MLVCLTTGSCPLSTPVTPLLTPLVLSLNLFDHFLGKTATGSSLDILLVWGSLDTACMYTFDLALMLQLQTRSFIAQLAHSGV